ncbi:MAG: GNAT family N-acetyltransferase [Oscillochloris sp.]|nr:GNAT family N-acetyltransferase [Oscillochloris sp.]
MKLSMRKYHNDDDDWSIRQFLRDVSAQNQRRALCWPLYRWDYWRWHVNAHIWQFNPQAALFLWHTAAGGLAAVLHPDGPGEAFLEVHPAFRSPELEVELMTMAETQFAVSRPNGAQRLTIWAYASDLLRREVLQRRGYRRGDHVEYQRRRGLELPIPAAPAPAGYAIRALGDEAEHPARSWLSWKVFHPCEPDEAYAGWRWYRDVQRAPLYRRDLDLVAVAPDGELVAFCTLWFDDVTRTVALEPVGVHPAHQRKGLARAIISEGLRRSRDLGATLCSVDSYSDAAGACYGSLGFTTYDVSEPWCKKW